jgi:hypothetical protein
MITLAAGGYSYLSLTCQQTSPLQTISADALTAENAKMLAPTPAIASTLLAGFMWLSFP